MIGEEKKLAAAEKDRKEEAMKLAAAAAVEKDQAQKEKIEDELLTMMKVDVTKFKLIREKSKILQEFTADVIDMAGKLQRLWMMLDESTSLTEKSVRQSVRE